MPQFFIKTEDILEDRITIVGDSQCHHLVRVLRIKVDEKLLLVDENQTIYEAVVEKVEAEKVCAKILSQKKSDHFLNTQIYLAQGVLKNDAQHYVIQKATELGAKGVIPIECKNSVVKGSVIDSKIDKWTKVALEAVKQCERTDIPVVLPRNTLEGVLKDDTFKIKIACAERNQECSLKKYLRNLKYNKEDKILVIIGPEGGFSQCETELFDIYKIPKVSLGKLILRAETAVTAAISNIIYELENE